MSIKHALLALLSEGPKYGLQLRQEFETRTGEVWPLNVGQVYTTLQGWSTPTTPRTKVPRKGSGLRSRARPNSTSGCGHRPISARRPGTSW